MTTRHWHTLTVRFATTGPIDRARIAAQPQPPQHAIGEALGKILGHLGGDILLDDVSLFPDDRPAPPPKPAPLPNPVVPSR